MDIYVTNIFQTMYEDLTLIYDAFVLNSKYNPNGNSLREIGQALGVLVHAESKVQSISENVSFHLRNGGTFASSGSVAQLTKFDLLHPSHSSNNVRVSDAQSQQWAREEIWEFIYTALVTFTLDYMSQYPFWRVKVLLCCVDDNPIAKAIIASGGEAVPKPVLWAKEFYETFISDFARHGAVGLFQGGYPYLVAVYLQNMTQMQMRISNLFKAIMTAMPINSTSYKFARTLSRTFSSNSLSIAPPVPTKKSRGTEVTHNFDENGDRADLVSDARPITETRIQRLIRKAFMHPFLLSAVYMVTSTKFVPWPVMNWKIWSKYGYKGFFSGWRVNLMFSLFAWTPLWSLGVYDTIVYRVMMDQNRQGMWRIVDNILQGVTAGSPVPVESSIANYSWEGTQNLFKFGFLTLGQLLPGFAIFAGCRTFVWLTLGVSRKRREQRRLRMEILENHWGRQYVGGKGDDQMYSEGHHMELVR